MKILIHGHYGNRNIGDDALGYVFSSNIIKVFSNAQLIIISNDDIKYWTNDTVRKNIKLYKRTKKNIIKAWLQTNVIIYAGGTHFQDYGKFRDKRNNMSLIIKLLIAKIMRKKILFIGGSVGPLQSKTSMSLAKIGLKLSDDNWFRDKESIKWLNIPNADYLTDTVVMIPEFNAFKNDKKYKCLGVSTEYFFASAYGDVYKDEAVLNSIGYALKSLMKNEEDLFIKFFAFQSNGYPSEDIDSINYIIDSCNLDKTRIRIIGYDKLLDFIGEINTCTYFLAYRLHSAVLAYSYGIPYVSIEYHPKVKGFNDTVRLPKEARVDINNVDSRDLLSKLTNLVNGEMKQPEIDRLSLSTEVQNKFRNSLSKLK